MLPLHISYPAFEANQVLSNEHLNQLFAYLDEQERLSRTNLIGIGVVCGLEPRLEEDDSGLRFRISKGCGVTSEGYLIVWPDAAMLEWYKPYSVPENIPYREFEDRSGETPQPFPLWELTPDRDNNPEAVRLSRDFLKGGSQPPGNQKILVLFLECLAVSNRNCTPNSCADKGTTITATVRPLLVGQKDLDLLLERIQSLGPETEAYFNLSESMASRLALPTLKLPRFDVAATRLNSTASIFDAFQRVISKSLVQQVAKALSDTYHAFQPLLPDFTASPFTSLNNQWFFLHDGSLKSSNRYLWFQYYYDHLDTIIQAYNEFRLRSLHVLGLCCPDSRLFPRHLMLANLGNDPFSYDYRHHFVSSPIFTRQFDGLMELRQLFRRLVLLVQGLELPPNVGQLNRFFAARRFPTHASQIQPGTEIKITPSKLAAPLSEKAIPYHYDPSLYQYWNFQLNRQGKAHENLGYRSNVWNTTDDFVRFPLNFELEPYNFLRMEGHLGQNFVTVMGELLSQRDRFRLPIDIVALKTGRNANDIPLPEDAEGCHFQDLEALYDTLREGFLCQICETVKQLYNTPIIRSNISQSESSTMPANLAFLKSYAPGFRSREGTVGQLYENNLSKHTTRGPSLSNVPDPYKQHTYFIFNLVRLAGSLSGALKDLDFDTFQNNYSEFFASVWVDNENGSFSGMDAEELSDQLDMLLHSCKLKPIQSVWDEYQRRLQRIRERLLLSTFARTHPGLVHKAGVPLGGTLVLVYHGENQQEDRPSRPVNFTLTGRVTFNGTPQPGASLIMRNRAWGTVTDLNGYFNLTVNELPVMLQVGMVGVTSRQVLVTNENAVLNIDLNEPDSTDMPDRFPALATGTVIADFYLPYLCCSDCQPIQFVLPKAPPTFSWEQTSCTNANHAGFIAINPHDGTPPYEVSLDRGQNWNGLTEEPVMVHAGDEVVIRDAEGIESTPRAIKLTPPLTIETGQIECIDDDTKFTVEIMISGGRGPYHIFHGEEVIEALDGSAKPRFASGEGGTLRIEDSSEPPCQTTLAIQPHPCEPGCELPCKGITMECGHPFWMQIDPSKQWQYQEVQLEVMKFFVQDETSSQSVSFSSQQLSELTEILNPNTNFMNADTFSQFWNNSVPKANDNIQTVLQEVFGKNIDSILTLRYDPDGVGSFTTLWIETYDCFHFLLDINLQYFENTTKFRYDRTWQYSNEGSQVIGMVEFNGEQIESSARVPRFNCTRRDRCHPEAKPVPQCEKPFEVRITSKPILTDQHHLSAIPEEIVANSALLWNVQQGIPGISGKSSFEVRVPFGSESGNVARVLVVNPDTGCAAAAEINLNSIQ